MSTTKPVSGQVSPDRVSALEAEVAQLKLTLAEIKSDVFTGEGLIRDLGQIMIQLTETHKATVIELAKVQAHAEHDEAFRDSPAALFCQYCTPVNRT